MSALERALLESSFDDSREAQAYVHAAKRDAEALRHKIEAIFPGAVYDRVFRDELLSIVTDLEDHLTRAAL